MVLAPFHARQKPFEHQIFKKGDWSIKRPELEPGGWAFEFHKLTALREFKLRLWGQ
jgi:hypothetical protein